ncbi:hypothetical protein RYZ27_00440 [Hyphomonas sp. FCG-A18]|uniref:hypothetical protein n=1 Tax=Hyphomonas sp. FCG-A18 TaxID=3080019 RepID=UPI002B2F0BB4|nr:hypothetical protein RYZ27_00440 [Hyphomonas sp. FCG-A18]
MKPMIFGLGASLFAAAACQHVAETQPSAGKLWFEALADLCGQGAFAGQLVSDDEVDAEFKTSALIAGPATCTEGEVRIPFAVDDDRSRTWVITETEAGLRFKHDHRHKDGTKDVLTWYGGDVLGEGTVNRQEFPVDAETRALFTREGIEVSNQNTWAMDIVPGETLTYQMWRPNRNFQVEFDLTTEIPAPPLPWGVEPIE